MSFVQTMTSFGESVPLPDVVTRAAINLLVGRTQRVLSRAPRDADRAFASAMAPYPIAINTADANAQHYEIPADFFNLVLGPQRKYSSCLYDDGVETLAAAEERALQVTAEHASLADGQRILELGCGWGSLSLWMARHFPAAQITSVSNSNSQREFVTGKARTEGLANLRVVTTDMNEFQPVGCFDRVVSVEMFEHMANWQPLLRRMRDCLEADGRMFMHVFANRTRRTVSRSTTRKTGSRSIISPAASCRAVA
jgi:cyclopropane-fatty-acyl-phospholipid synthase